MSGFDGEKTLPRSSPFCVFSACRNCLLDGVSYGVLMFEWEDVLEGRHGGLWWYCSWGVVRDHSEA